VNEGGFDKLTDRAGFAGSQHEVVSFAKLQKFTNAFDVIRRISPVAFCVQVAEEQLLLQTMLDRSNRPRDFACDERFAASRAFMVKHGAVASAKTVAFPIIDGRQI
jgi:hypothetical protein